MSTWPRHPRASCSKVPIRADRDRAIALNVFTPRGFHRGCEDIHGISDSQADTASQIQNIGPEQSIVIEANVDRGRAGAVKHDGRS